MDVLGELKAEQLKSAEMEQGRRAKRFTEYLELLRRLGEPEKNDKGRLAKLMKGLGFDLATVEDHLAVLHDFEAAEAALAAFTREEEEAEKGRPRLQELREEIRKLEAEAAPLKAKFYIVQEGNRVRAKSTAEARLRALGFIFGRLFGTGVPDGLATTEQWVEVGKANRARARAWGLAPERLDTEDFRRRDEAGSIR